MKQKKLSKVILGTVLATTLAFSASAELMAGVYTPEEQITPQSEVQTSGAVQNSSSYHEAYALAFNEQYSGRREYINSGWVLDNRGGPARKTQGGAYDILTDVSASEGTALIRQFNKIDEGEIVIETSLRTSGNGVSLEARDESDNVVYRLKLIGGAWKIMTSSTAYTTLVTNSGTTNIDRTFKFRIILNLDNGQSTTFIDDVNLGTHNLLGTNIKNFRFATDEASMINVIPGEININANYFVNEIFSVFEPLSVYGWTTSGNVGLDNKELYFDGAASAQKNFSDLSGKSIFETYLILPAGENMSIALRDGETSAVTFASTNGKFYVNNAEEYTLSNNMWYRLRVEADTATGTANVLLNGRSIAETTFTGVSALDNVLVTTSGGDVRLDNIRVYPKVEHADYVPAPTVSDDEYIVGMNVCSIWRNGTHYGWGCISAYNEPEPVMGYYDEGVPETADWEIKFMADHGIDFQAFCWYPDSTTGPIKVPYSSDVNNLHDGYMYAKYSDSMKYVINWETSGTAPSQSHFRNHIIPYWFENYFLDDRYLKIDNQIVLFVFGATSGKINQGFGNDAAVKAEFDYLESVAQSYGFDGVIFISSTLASWYNPNADTGVLVNMGFDGSSFYSRTDGTGSTFEGNKTMANTWGAQRDLQWIAAGKPTYSIATATVGFDSIPWHGTRIPNITVNEFKQTLEWLRDDYHALYGDIETPNWHKKMVMLGNWNEFGEGHYINPSALNGFGYLDAVREVFTNLPAEHTDVVPTSAQKERINHLYPQDMTLLRKQGYYDASDYTTVNHKLYINESEVTSVILPENNGTDILFAFDPTSGVEFMLNSLTTWQRHNKVLTVEANGHKVVFTVGSGTYTVDGEQESLGYTLYERDGLPMIPFNKLATALGYTYEVSGTTHNITTPQYDYFVNVLNGSRVGEWTFDDYNLAGWSSNYMRLIPNSNGTVTLESLDDYEDPAITVDGLSIPLENYTGITIRIGNYDWANDAGMTYSNLSIYYSENGSSYARIAEKWLYQNTLDGFVEYYLPFTGDFTGKTATTLRFDPFNAHGKMDIDLIRFVPKADWQFNSSSTEGWTSSHMTLTPNSNGTLTMTSSGNYATYDDPAMTISGLNIDLSQYKGIKVRFGNFSWENAAASDYSPMAMYYKPLGSNTYAKIGEKWLYTKTQDGLTEYYIPFTSADYTGKILETLRFDPFNAHGSMDLDFLTFVEKDEWNFNSGATEGWVSDHMTLTSQDGILSLQSAGNYATYDDPCMTLSGLNIDLSKYKGFKIKVGNVNWENASASPHTPLAIYYKEKGSNTYQKIGEKYFYTSSPVTDMTEFYIPFTSADYTGKIMQMLRFDPFNAHGSMDIDYIKLVPKDEWNFNNSSVEGWTSEHMTLTANSTGTLTMTSSGDYATYDDPNMTLTGLDLKLDNYTKVEIKVKNYSWANAGNTANTPITVYYSADGVTFAKLAGSWIYSQTSSEETTYTLTFTETALAGKFIKSLRFDPFNAHGSMEIDYIKLI